MDNWGSRRHVLWNGEEATLHRPGWQSKSRLVYPPALSLCVCVLVWGDADAAAEFATCGAVRPNAGSGH